MASDSFSHLRIEYGDEPLHEEGLPAEPVELPCPICGGGHGCFGVPDPAAIRSQWAAVTAPGALRLTFGGP